MSSQDLHQIEAGDFITHVDRRNANGGWLRVCDIYEGIVPDGTDIEEAVVAVEPTSRGETELVVALDDIDSGQADVQLETRDQQAREEPIMLRAAVDIVLARSGVEVGILREGPADLPPGFLQRAHFAPMGEGVYEFSRAA